MMKFPHLQNCLNCLIVLFIHGSRSLTFINHSRSFAEFSNWNSTKDGVISLRFKTASQSGLVICIGHCKKSDKSSKYKQIESGMSNFMQLKVESGMLNLIIQNKTWKNKIWRRKWTTTNVDDSRWHYVQLQKNGLMLRLDNLTFNIKNIDLFLPFHTKVFAGGYPGIIDNEECILRRIPRSLIGCIENVIYKIYNQEGNEGTVRALQIRSHMVENGCVDKCQYIKCLNNGSCINKFITHQCYCFGTGYEGKTCSTKSSTMWLSGYDFIRWRPIRDQMSQTRNEIKMRFKTRYPTALLLFLGNASNFLNIGLSKGFLVIMIKMGREPFHLNVTNATLDNNFWHMVEVSRRENQMTVILNRTQVIKRRIPGRPNERQLYGDLVYVGGIKDKDVINKLGKSSTRGCNCFIGCLQHVYYNEGNIIDDMLAENQHRGTAYGDIRRHCEEENPITQITRPTRRRAGDPPTNRSRPTRIKTPKKPVKTFSDKKTKNVLKIVGGVIGLIVFIIFVAATGHYLKKKYAGLFLNISSYTGTSSSKDTGNGSVKYKPHDEDITLFESSLSGSSCHTTKSYRAVPQKV